MKKSSLTFFIFFVLIAANVYAAEGELRLSDEVIGMQVQDIPERPAPPVELGDPLFGVGPIQKGFQVPTGAVWQPSFIIFGDYRTAVQSFYNGSDYISEWANRLDLYANLSLTPTERFLVGVRFLEENGNFTGYTIHAPESVRKGENGFDNHFDFDITTAFFEGDLGEVLPFLDPNDARGLDFGLAVGRQPLNFQDGMLINDYIDSVGISKINLKPPGVSNMRSAFVWGAAEINRTNLEDQDSDATLWGLFNEFDFRHTTLELDTIYVGSGDDTGKGLYTALGAIQRMGMVNTTLRVLSSNALSDETTHNSDGVLVFGEISISPRGTHNHLYLNGFRGFDQFRSASRDPLAGGPLARTGILYEAVGLGRYDAPLENSADESYGGALGYQIFFNHSRQNLILELGGRYGIAEDAQRAVGAGARFSTAVGRRGVVRIDGYALHDEERTIAATEDDQLRLGGRIEFLLNF